jgi:selenocysteine-specific elongation factor
VDGELRVGQEVELQPGGLRARIRGLQSHKQKVDLAVAGSRVAVNLTGVAVEQLERGQVVTNPGVLQPTMLADVRLRLVSDLPRPVAHNTQVTFHSGTAEAAGRLRLLDEQALEPGASAVAQGQHARPQAQAKGVRFVVRPPSPSLTLGGGSVIEPHSRRHRRFQEAVLQRLEVLEQGSSEDVLLQHLRTREPADVEALARRSGAAAAELRPTLATLLERGDVLTLGPADGLGPRTLLVSRPGWARLRDRLAATLAEFHRSSPLRRGMPREEVRARLGIEPRVFARALPALEAEGVVAEEGPLLRLAEHAVRLDPAQQRAADSLLARLEAAGATPPTRAELEAASGAPPELTQALIERGDLVEVAPDLVYRRDTFEALRERVMDAIRERGRLTVAEVRDLLGASRRYALPLLALLDEQHVTRRVGDDRVLY